MSTPLAEHIDDVVRGANGIVWSICVRSDTQRVVVAHREGEPMWTASVGKVLLLLETARRMELDPELGSRLLSRHGIAPVGEAGLWQHLRVADLAVDDVATLVGSVSDNLAYNVLLKHVGLASVTTLAEELGLVHTRLLDFVRSERTTADSPNMSRGSAGELCALMAGLAAGSHPTPKIAQQVVSWLGLTVDLSMVGCAFNLDPLSHRGGSSVSIFNKTGGDAGIRADVGAIRVASATVSYAVIANWPPTANESANSALSGMRHISDALRAHLGATAATGG